MMLAGSPAPILLRQLVGLGLARFAEIALDGEVPAAIAVLRRNAAEEAPGLAPLPWPAQLAVIGEAWRSGEGPFKRLSDHLGLEAADLFLLGLAGGCESSFLMELALAAVQGTESGPRPS